MSVKNRCPGSGTIQYLDWEPDEDGYPGACVCIECSLGVVVLKGSVRQHENGLLSGKLRVHSRE